MPKTATAERVDRDALVYLLRPAHHGDGTGPHCHRRLSVRATVDKD